MYLLRFLRARKFEIEKVYEMWDNFIKWREDNKMDDILVKQLLINLDYQNLKFPEYNDVIKVYPHFYFNTDKQVI